MKTNNYIDTLTIYAKKNISNELISRYEVFGWKISSLKENEQYEDIVDITFTRDHSISNKDELQLLQVHMEEKLNTQAKLEKYKHSRLISLALCFGIIGLYALVIGLLMAFHVFPHVGIIAGAISMFIGFSLFLFGFITLPRVYKLEKEYYDKESKKLKIEIENITKKAKSLSGGNYEN